MRTILAQVAITTLFTAFGFAQSPFYFSQPASFNDMASMATAIRTVADLQHITVDEAHRSLVVQGPADKMLVADWMFHQLDRPAVASPSGPAPQYRVGGEQNDVTSVFRLPASATGADLTALVTSSRTVVDVQRIFPYEAQHAIVARAEADKIEATDWLVGQLWPADGKIPTTDSPAYPFSPMTGFASREPDPTIRIFRMDPSTPASGLTAMVTAIRTIADLQRLFPYVAGKAVIGIGSADKIAVAGWLVHEFGKTADPQATHATTLPGVADGTVRLFYVDQKKSQADLTALVTQIRSKTGITRIFPFAGPAAVVLRGRPDQMPLVEELLAEYALAPTSQR
jgi:hypothetical protein